MTTAGHLWAGPVLKPGQALAHRLLAAAQGGDATVALPSAVEDAPAREVQPLARSQ